MSVLRKKIAQLLIMGFPESELLPHSPVVKWIKQEGIGGVILFDMDFPQRTFGKNLYNHRQICKLNEQLRQCTTSETPLFIAVDYEGGYVDRLQRIEGSPKTLTPLQQGQLAHPTLQEVVDEMAQTLRDLGFNLNFSPVVDLNLNDQQGIIGKLDRSFSDDPLQVARVASEVVTGFNAQGIACCYKHFPGHGSAVGDTHEGFVDVTSTYCPTELEPYRLLLNNADQRAMVMTAHVINRHLDPTGVPATLSYPILTELLRETLGFEGVIISDDLQMQAISDHYSLEDSMALTLNAGADMMIFGNQLGYHDASDVIDCIEGLVKVGQIPARRIEEAFSRVTHLKQSMVSAGHEVSQVISERSA